MYVELLFERLPIEIAPHQISQLKDAAGRLSAAPRNSLPIWKTLRDSLIEVGAQRLADSDVRRFCARWRIFGFHLAQLDIRQNSVFHSKALSQLMNAAGLDGSQWEEWSEAERLRFLEKELRSPRPFLSTRPSRGTGSGYGALPVTVFSPDTLHAAVADGLGALIISMTRRPFGLARSMFWHAKPADAHVAGRHCLCAAGGAALKRSMTLSGAGDLGAFLEEPMTRRSLEFLAWNGGASGSAQSAGDGWLQR
jgi:phosphoenolpyruvate carboxylase